jgi:hypothetical protein
MKETRHLEQRSEAQETSTAGQEHITRGLGDREQVERTADRIRGELLLTLEELDRRKDRALDVRLQLSQHRGLILGTALAAAALVGVGMGFAVWRSRHRESILARRRMTALKRAWHHPGRVASAAEQRPLAVELGRKLILIFGTALATSIAKSSVQTLVPRRAEPMER